LLEIQMHKSRLAGLSIDCNTDDLFAAADFWSKVLGVPRKTAQAGEEANYVPLDMPAEEPTVEVQRVNHASRVHLDIESDDVEAEVKRLEMLGARKVASVKDWCVMEAPTGQRFCVVPAQSAAFDQRAHEWP
jgi:catechol 2,3-dioxygenase-like lactoylglutathione lyase family enzyme